MVRCSICPWRCNMLAEWYVGWGIFCGAPIAQGLEVACTNIEPINRISSRVLTPPYTNPAIADRN